MTQKAREAGYLTDERNPNEGRYLELLIEDPPWMEGRPRAPDAVKALALLALASMDRWVEETQARADDLYVNRRALPPAAQAFLLLAVFRRSPWDPRVGVLQGVLEDVVRETPTGRATVALPSEDPTVGYVSSSPTFVEGAALWALARTGSQSALLPKLGRGLVERRRGPGWGNAHDGALAVLALSELATARPGPTETDLVVDSRVTGRAIQTSVSLRGLPYAAHTGTLALWDLPAGFFASAVASPDNAEGPGIVPGAVVIQRRGSGTLFFGVRVLRSAGLTGPPEAMVLERTFRPVRLRSRSPEIVRAGDLLTMTVSLKSRAPLRHVTVEVPLPAGVTPTQTSDETSPVAPGWWVSHEERHTDRVLLFADDVGPGEHQHTVTLRATAPGRYDLPPARASSVYHPDIETLTPEGTFVVGPSAP
jgi:uncharacterized protein YfaS (alpha-2-macroglobulin family)